MFHSDPRSLSVVLSPQEQGLDDVEKLMRRPKAKAEERLREVLEEFVAGCRLACPIFLKVSCFQVSRLYHVLPGLCAAWSLVLLRWMSGRNPGQAGEGTL